MGQETKSIRQERLLHDMLNSHYAAYLTIVSIIQSALLGYFLVQIQTNFDTFKFHHWFRVIVLFLTIMLIWNEYRMDALIYSWIPTIRDSFIPFLFAVAQFYLILNIMSNVTYYWAGTIAFSVAILAHFNVIYSATTKGENDEILDVIGDYCWINVASSIAATAIFGLFTFISGKYGTIIPLLDISSLFIFILYTIRAELYWNKAVVFAQGESPKEHSKFRQNALKTFSDYRNRIVKSIKALYLTLCKIVITVIQNARNKFRISIRKKSKRNKI